jgi:hypothetical protein
VRIAHEDVMRVPMLKARCRHSSSIIAACEEERA